MKEEQGNVFPLPIPCLPSYPESGEIFVREEGQADFASTMSINRGSQGSFAAKGPPVPLAFSLPTASIVYLGSSTSSPRPSVSQDSSPPLPLPPLPSILWASELSAPPPSTFPSKPHALCC